MLKWALNLPWNHIQKVARSYKVDPLLLGCIVKVESNGCTYATRYEPAYKYTYYPREFAEKLDISYSTEVVAQCTSWGLGQVMGGLARELKYQGHLTALCDPELGLKYAAKNIIRLFEKYDEESDVVSAYNQGSNRKESSGMYQNQRYVDKVYLYLRELRKPQ